jgi:AmmeMemoRadiSam system protein B
MSNSIGTFKRQQPRHNRDAVVSGIFYPSSAKELSQRIDTLLNESDRPSGHCAAIVSPHGSLEYSGTLAAKAWKAASARKIGTIIILSPSHRCFEPGIFLPEAHSFSVPTGTFKVDRPVVRELLHCTTSLRLSDIPHFEEHSIEMQLIYAAHCFPAALILPIIISGTDDPAIDSLFANIQFILGDRLASTLFVLTTNLAVDEDADNCFGQSAAFVEALEKGETQKLQTFCDSAPSFCGGRIIAAYMRSTLSSGMQPTIFGMGSSAAFAEQGEPIVGYAAIGFSR